MVFQPVGAGKQEGVLNAIFFQADLIDQQERNRVESVGAPGMASEYPVGGQDAASIQAMDF